MTVNFEFEREKMENIARMGVDQACKKAALDFLLVTAPFKYSYNTLWLGRPAIQLAQDMVAMQELIWSIKPDLIIETGIAHGGSLIFSASMLAQLDICDAIETSDRFNPNDSHRKVVGIDIVIHPHNRAAIEAHPMSSRITMIEGSSIAPETIAKVRKIAENYKCIIVILDSNHTHDHVLAELEAYASLVTPGSYCVVFDTIIEDMPASFFPDRPWGPGDNPKTAARKFLESHPEFEIDRAITDKLLITVAPDGFLKRVA